VGNLQLGNTGIFPQLLCMPNQFECISLSFDGSFPIVDRHGLSDMGMGGMSTCQDAAADGDGASERALVVDVGACMQKL